MWYISKSWSLLRSFIVLKTPSCGKFHAPHAQAVSVFRRDGWNSWINRKCYHIARQIQSKIKFYFPCAGYKTSAFRRIASSSLPCLLYWVIDLTFSHPKGDKSTFSRNRNPSPKCEGRLVNFCYCSNFALISAHAAPSEILRCVAIQGSYTRRGRKPRF